MYICTESGKTQASAKPVHTNGDIFQIRSTNVIREHLTYLPPPQCYHKDHPTPQIWPQIQCHILLIHMDLNVMYGINNSSGGNNYDDDSFLIK